MLHLIADLIKALINVFAIALLIAGDRVIKKSRYIPNQLMPKIERMNDVVEANITMSELARATNRDRESLYKTLSEKGNPQLNSIRSILNQIGFKLAVEVNQ